jgi:hypothetical protein
MKKGIITSKWNLVQDGVIIAQCFADTRYEALGYFEGANLPLSFNYEDVRFVH